MRGSLERDISSLRALGPGGGQISRVVHVSTRAAFGVFAEKSEFIPNVHVQKTCVFLCCFCFWWWGVCKIRMPRKPIYFWMFGFTQNMHVYNTVVFLNCWFYTKFACPENQLVFGLLVLYQICMPRKHLFWECWGYSKFACPGSFLRTSQARFRPPGDKQKRKTSKKSE